MQRGTVIGISAAALVAAASGAAAQDVAIVAAAGSFQADDVEAILVGSGAFDSVANIALETSTPTLAELEAFDSIIVWTNTTPDDNVAVGNVLADYVDGGGGVVVAVFANSTTTTTRQIAGRWQGSAEYEVIVPGSGNQTGQAGLGTILEPHPIMDGVATFDGGTSSFRPVVTDLRPGARAIAEWDDGRVLVAIGANEKRVDLAFYPPSADAASGWWDPATDGDLMLVQSLLFAAGNDCRADFDFDGELTIFDFLAFQNAFDAGDLAADFDGDGQLTIFDFLEFQNEFDAGCE
ncbi:MAG: GC-type dockerin domain-anchored protein [Planctomycetota bacterium]